MTSSENTYAEIENLVKGFKALSPAQRKGMNENATRQGYILPLFRALGWDTDNINEVCPEEKVSRGFVDFSFRIGGIPRYFLETKKASEDLNDPRWVQQAIDYAWTKSVTWALLSDFEGLRVFNAEWKETDPFRAEFLSFDLDSYLTDFERLWWFSREESLAGRLEREADKVGKRIKRLPVSQHLFDDLKLWRSELYKSLRGFNPKYSPAQIDEAILRLLNRLIFIRTAEDRQVEPTLLRPLIRELKAKKQFGNLSQELTQLFHQMDESYNSELFAPHFSEELYCDAVKLEELIEGLYEKNYVRYNFNALEADVLGTAYEQYLGHIVTETRAETGLISKAAHVEEKRTKRKSQGIYYTPAFVTKYIVQQTVGRYLDEHSYNPSRPPRILDMACGSGSFLIEAFDTLDHFVAKLRHQAYGYGEDMQDFARRIELLNGCIFGVDKDKQAVDVARLNLMLRSLYARQKMPLLTNIGEGDSLISGTPEELQVAFGENWQIKKPFNWEEEFPEVMKEGGFDVIIGNPPYIRAENMPREERDYYMDTNRFSVAYGRFDIHILFLERALKLLKDGGRLGYIIPYPAFNQSYAKLLRRLILDTCAIETIVDLSKYKVFETAEVATCIVILHKDKTEMRRDNQIIVVQQSDYSAGIHDNEFIEIPQSAFDTTVENMFRLELDSGTNNISAKIDASSLSLGKICYAITGVVAHDSKTGASKDRLIHPTAMGRNPKPYLEAKEIFGRYSPLITKQFIEYVPKEMHRPKFPELFEKPKILIPGIIGPGGLLATLDTTGIFTNHSFNCCVLKDDLLEVGRNLGITAEDAVLSSNYSLFYVLGLVNSKLITYYFKTNLGGGLHASPANIRRLPIHRIDFDDPAEKATHDEIVRLVEQMLDLQKQRQEAEAGKEDVRFALKKRIQALDTEIDRLVYELYGLTEEEIKIVEGG